MTKLSLVVCLLKRPFIRSDQTVIQPRQAMASGPNLLVHAVHLLQLLCCCCRLALHRFLHAGCVAAVWQGVRSATEQSLMPVPMLLPPSHAWCLCPVHNMAPATLHVSLVSYTLRDSSVSSFAAAICRSLSFSRARRASYKLSSCSAADRCSPSRSFRICAGHNNNKHTANQVSQTRALHRLLSAPQATQLQSQAPVSNDLALKLAKSKPAHTCSWSVSALRLHCSTSALSCST